MEGPPEDEDKREGEKREENLMIVAAQKGNVSAVRRALAKTNVNANQRDERLFTPLIWGAANRHTKVVQALVQEASLKGVDLNARNEVGDTALHWACWKGDLTSVWLLLRGPNAQQGGADVGIQGENGMLPLHLAASGGHREVLVALLEWGGSNLDTRNDFGNTADLLTTEKDLVDMLVAARTATNCGVCDKPLEYAKRTRHQCHYCHKQVCPDDSTMKFQDEEVMGVRVCRNCQETHITESLRRKAEEEERARRAKMNESSNFTAKVKDYILKPAADEVVQDLLMSRAVESGAPIADFTINAATRALLPVRAPGMWATVRLYISSTKDMHSERVYLRDVVVPALRHFCRMRRVHFVAVDLIEGATDQELRARSALELALENVDECRPLFISMMGERYGIIPDMYEVPQLQKFDWVNEVPAQSQSITEMEARYGFGDHANTSLGFFYFRDPKFMTMVRYKQQTDHVKEYFEEREAKDAIAGETGGTRSAENSRLKLKSLKDELQAVVPAQQLFNNYPCEFEQTDENNVPELSGLEEFGRRVFTDVWTALDVAYPMRESGEKHTVLASFQTKYIEHLCRNFYGRSKYLQAMVDYASQSEVPDGEGNVMLVTGEPGMGKSAVLGEFVRQFSIENEGVFVFYHFMGAGGLDNDARSLILRMCQEMTTHFQLTTPVSLLERQDFNALRRSFKNLLQESSQKGLCIFVVDGMHDLEMEGINVQTPGGEIIEGFQPAMYDWLPEMLPQRVRMILSTSTQGPKSEWLSARYNTGQISIGPLDDTESREIVRTYLGEYGIEVTREDIGIMMRKADANKPLYLTTLADELRLHALPDQHTQFLKDAAPTVDGLFESMIDRLEDAVNRNKDEEGGRGQDGRKAIETALGAIHVARIGLHESDLLELTGYIATEDGTAMAYIDWAKIVYHLKSQLRPAQGGAGVTFYHQQFRDVVERRYLPDIQSAHVYHKALAGHYRRSSDPLNDRTWLSWYNVALLELPFHLNAGEMLNEMSADMCDIKYVERRCAIQSITEFCNWYKRALANPRLSEETYVRMFQQFAQQWQQTFSKQTYSQAFKNGMETLCGIIEDYAHEAQYSLTLAREGLRELTDQDIQELSSQKSPQASIKHVMEMTLLCKGNKGTSWKAARSALQSGNLINDVCNIQVTSMKEKATNKAIKQLDNHQYTMWEMKLKSAAAAAFLQWCTAITHHFKKYHAYLDQEKANQPQRQVSEEERTAAMALIEKATTALKGVSKGAITELKSQANPPELVKVVMNCVLLFLGVDRISWQDAAVRLADVNFIPTLLSFDRDGVKRDVLNKVEAVMHASPDMTVESLSQISNAAAAICEWTFATQNYVRMIMGPEKVETKKRKKGKKKAK